MRRILPLSAPLDLRATLAPLRHGRDDPSLRVRAGEVLRATRTPEGPATVHVRLQGAAVVAEAYGPGEAWALDHLPDLVGEHDDRAGFEPAHPVVARLQHHAPGLRIPRSLAPVEALVPTILAQRVTHFEAVRSYHQLVHRWGEPAPGPGGLLLQPAPEVLAALPYYELHVAGVEKKRADALRRVGGSAPRIEALAEGPADHARLALGAIPGIGPWTVAEVALVALGDADAVSVGDHNLKHQVAWALAGEERGTDHRMLELLEPYVGHRGRVCRLVVHARLRPPRRAPRQAIEPLACR